MSNQTKMASIGPYWFVDNDVRQFAEWGIDYVKYDWSERVDQDELMSYVRDHQAMPDNAKTHYGVDPKQGKYEYWTRRFRDSFRATDRDIILSLSPRSDFASAKVNSTYSNLWRTTEDIYDSWASISESFHNDHWRPYQRQGHWNDPDMLQIGNKGVPNQFVRTLEPSRLTPNEQYTQMTLWSMIAAPLLMSCDIASMDDFTLGLLTNPEVLEINQDALGIQGKPAVIDGDIQVWTRELADGSKAVAIFNLGYGTDLANVNFEQLGLAKEQRVRDVWSHKDLGVKSNGFEESLKGHQSRLFKVSRP
jgi:alpha-galactosidase